LPQAELARPYNVTRQTIRKWQDRDSPDDGSHCPTTLKTTLTPEQELIVIELRKTLLLPTDDLLAVTREFINPAVSRAGLGRCLRRHGVSSLLELAAREKPTSPSPQSRSRTTSPAFYLWISSTCRRGLTKPNAVTCASPFTAPRAGSSWKSMPTSATAAAPTSCSN
jgi:hypothetical protein